MSNQAFQLAYIQRQSLNTHTHIKLVTVQITGIYSGDTNSLAKSV